MEQVEQKKKYQKDYQYNVGDVVNGLIITKQCYKKESEGWNRKAYQYKCITCGYDCSEYYKNGKYYSEHMIIEKNLNLGVGCIICANNGFVSPRINSIHVVAPFMEKFLIDSDNAQKYAPQSKIKVKCKCLDCGKEYERSCYKIYQYGVPCVCGDGFSYPEKFVFNLLNQLKVNFKPQYYLQDSLYRYDFYLHDYDILLEVNGIQHYKQKWERDEVENDKNKKDFAFSCGYTDENYIVLDCRESNLNFIKSSIMQSKLSDIFNLDKVNFIECAEFATNNFAKIASELWNAGNTIKEITKRLNVNKHTTIAYLKQGNDNGWCVYNAGDGTKRYHQKQK